MSAVLTLDGHRFEAACASLWALASGENVPDLLIGIRTGGLVVAEAMARAAGAGPVLALTCRRPSTAHKQRHGVARDLVARLPRPALDRLRLIEHAVLSRRPPTLREIDPRELAKLDACGARAVVIVDDAVDSGATLAAVVAAVRARLPAAEIRTAAIVVTTERPLIAPDYSLYRGQLCRFPWSLDSRSNDRFSSSTSMARS